MNNIKIIFFDIDGTLMAMSAKKMTSKTKEALLKLQGNGIKICIATGRCPCELPDFSSIVFDAYLTFNGSYCYAKKDIIYSLPLDKHDIYQVINNATNLNLPLAMSSKDQIIANGISEDLKHYFQISNAQLKDTLQFNQFIQTEDIYQMMLSCYPHHYSEILWNTTSLKIASWCDKAIDIIPKDSGKGIGIHKILEYFNIDKENALAFGDGDNDIDMFKSVQYGIAMDNASSLLKQYATDICDSVTEDGIYNYCVQHNLI